MEPLRLPKLQKIPKRRINIGRQSDKRRRGRGRGSGETEREEKTETDAKMRRGTTAKTQQGETNSVLDAAITLWMRIGPGPFVVRQGGGKPNFPSPAKYPHRKIAERIVSQGAVASAWTDQGMIHERIHAHAAQMATGGFFEQRHWQAESQRDTEHVGANSVAKCSSPRPRHLDTRPLVLRDGKAASFRWTSTWSSAGPRCLP